MPQLQRIRCLDVIRGVAVLGIFAVNVIDMAYPEALAMDPRAAAAGGQWDAVVAFGQEWLFAGKMRGLFTLLFGVSALLILDQWRREAGAKVARSYYFRRLLWLIPFGLVNAYLLLWWGDVLFKYALLGILLYPLHSASRGLLAAAAVACLTALVAGSWVEYRDVAELERQHAAASERILAGTPATEDDLDAMDEWQEILAEAVTGSAWQQRQITARAGGYPAAFAFNRPLALEEQTTLFLGEDLLDLLLFMLLGMLLWRSGFFDSTIGAATHGRLALLGLGCGLLIHLWMNIGLYRHHGDPVATAQYRLLYDLGRVPFVIGLASLAVLLSQAGVARRAGDALAAAGRMALSNYLLQSAIGALTFYGFGLALFNQLGRTELIGFIMLVWAIQLAFSILWLRRFHQGPLEWLWRMLARGRRAETGWRRGQ